MAGQHEPPSAGKDLNPRLPATVGVADPATICCAVDIGVVWVAWSPRLRWSTAWAPTSPRTTWLQIGHSLRLWGQLTRTAQANVSAPRPLTPPPLDGSSLSVGPLERADGSAKGPPAQPTYITNCLEAFSYQHRCRVVQPMGRLVAWCCSRLKPRSSHPRFHHRSSRRTG
jgi:hypothetical protein